MKCLVIVAHGSRREASNTEIGLLADKVSELAGDAYDKVSFAYLEIAEPSIPDELSTLVETGAEEIHILPYFLAAGRHVQEDIPEDVEKVSRLNPHIKFLVKPHIGSSLNMPAEILAMCDM